MLFGVLQKPRVEEFYMVDVDKVTKEFESRVQKVIGGAPFELRDEPLSKLKIIQDPKYRRKSGTVDMEAALGSFNVQWYESDSISLKLETFF